MFCPFCKQDIPEEKFYRYKNGDFFQYCRACAAIYARQRRLKKKLIGGHCSGCYKPCESGFCERCASKPKNPEASRKAVSNYRKRNPDAYRQSYLRRREKIRLSGINYKLRLRRQIFEAYGHACACCGEKIFEFLEIDHIGGWGTKHRDEKGKRLAGSVLYLWIIRNNFPATIQLLCGSCHSAISYHGFCPHELRRGAVVPAAV